MLRRSNRAWQGKQYFFRAVDPNVTVYTGVITSSRGSAVGCGFQPFVPELVPAQKRYDSVLRFITG
jgi:hypothetical protein